MWLPLQTPALMVPLVFALSPQSIWQVWVSFAPASVNEALTDTLAPVVAPSSGAIDRHDGHGVAHGQDEAVGDRVLAPSSAVSVSS